MDFPGQFWQIFLDTQHQSFMTISGHIKNKVRIPGLSG